MRKTGDPRLQRGDKRKCELVVVRLGNGFPIQFETRRGLDHPQNEDDSMSKVLLDRV